MKDSKERMLAARALGCGPGLRIMRTMCRESLRCVADMVCLNYAHLSRIECGKRGASPEVLSRLAAYYKFSSVKKMLARAEQLQRGVAKKTRSRP